MSLRLYQYPNCSTCRRATKWLEAAGHTFESVHLVEATPNADVLRDLWTRSGLPIKRFFNTSGRVYREGGFGERLKTMSETQALAALAADGMLIKRPILDLGDVVLVGFKDETYEAALSA